MNIHLVRHIFQHHIDPRQDDDCYNALVKLGLDDEEIKAVVELGDWIANHGLERANRRNEL